jgi:hypothetical protein
MNRFILYVLIVYSNGIFAQLKVGKSPKVVENNSYLQIESDASRHLVVTKDSSKLGIGTTAPNFSLEMIGLNNNDALAIGNTILGSSFRGKISVLGSGANDRWMRFNSDWNSTTNNTRAFGFFRGTNEYLTILDNGNVGIGNISPSYKLDVAGKGRFSDTLFGTRAQFNNLDIGVISDSIVTIDASGNLKRRNANSYSNNWFSRTTNTSATSNTENIYQMGQVGIGTTVPTTNLDVVGGFSLRNVAAAAGTNFGMEFNTNSNSPRIDWVYNGSYTGSFAGDADFFFRLQNSRTGAGGFRFLTNPAGVGVERLTILNNGNIGISTTLPQTLLDVSPSSGGSSITVGTVGTASSDQVTVNFGTRYDRTSGVGSPTNLGWQIGGRGNAWPSPQTNTFHASYWNGSSWLQAVTIQPTGNFGIGATSPITTLHVNNPLLSTNTVNADAQVLRLSRSQTVSQKWDNIAQFNLGSYSNSTVSATSRLDLTLSDGAGTALSNVMTWQGNGNVGIGSTSPVSRLEVNGSATNTTAFNAAAGTTIDFSRSNLAYTTANAGAFTLTNIKDGGTYTLAVRGTTSATASFTSTGFTFKSVNNGVTVSGRETLYTFLVMGTTVYFYMASGF